MAEFGIVGHDKRLELIGGEVVPWLQGPRRESIKAAIIYRSGRSCSDGYLFAPETGLVLDEHTYLEPECIVFARTKRLAQVRGPDILLTVSFALDEFEDI